MKILVDQSGYDLLNLGDAAMLQACVTRLGAAWPGATVAVLTHDAGRLAALCPAAIPVDTSVIEVAGRDAAAPVRRATRAAEPFERILGPAILGRRRSAGSTDRQTALRAVMDADLVVGSGGGYLNDTWWVHALGVLSLLGLAQRRGLPTAMVGQGLGPLSNVLLRRLARRVLPGLHALGLREAVLGPQLAAELGVPPARVVVTGDDAVCLARATARASDPGVIGLNLRAVAYTGIDRSIVTAVGRAVSTTASRVGAPVLAVPVSLHRGSRDAEAIAAAVPGAIVPEHHPDLPADLARLVSQCRVMVTASYHAAVFALSQGTPAVCLTMNPYYEAKFAGLRELFGPACRLVTPGEDLQRDVSRALAEAWERGEAPDERALRAGGRQVAAGDRLYAALRRDVSGPVQDEPRPAMSDGRR